MRPLIPILLLLAPASLGFDNCGRPGIPQNGKVQQANETFTYDCPHSFIIDGDATRRCGADGKWVGTIPRCAAVRSLSSENEDLSELFDGDADTCLNFDSSLQMKLNRCRHILKVKLTASAEDEKVVLEQANVTLSVAGSFGQANDSAVLQWQLSEDDCILNINLPDEVNVTLCEVQAFTYPDDCGEPDETINGNFNRVNKTSGYCSCSTGFELVQQSPLKECSSGRWSGDQCVCKKSDPRNVCRKWKDLFVTFFGLFLIVIIGFAVFTYLKRAAF